MQPDHRSPETELPTATPRRQRLWQLPAAIHLSLVGHCLTPTELRRLTDRVFRGRTELDDARLLTAVAAECTTRNKVSDALQRALDARYVHTLASFRGAKSPEALALLWQTCADEGRVGAGMWSAATHPCADEAWHARLCRDVQMLQFDAIAARDTAQRRVDDLLMENGVLTRELARIQQRQTRWHAERRDEQADLAAVRLELIRSKAELAARTPPLEADALHGAEDRALARARDAASERELVASTAPAPRRPSLRVDALAVASTAATDIPDELSERPVEQALVDAEGEAKRILCVGGRTGHVPIYRALVEEQGGRFLHHDGGVEDNPKRLEAQLSAADLVICQTGCLSHNAYWRVKDHCKRTGTPCVYLDKPGAGSFLRGLVRAAPMAESVLPDLASERRG